MPIVEFVWWSGTEEFLANLDELFKPTIDHVSKADGCLRIYSGLQEEDKSIFWMVVVWKSHEHHQAMMDRPDYPEMVVRLKPFFRDGMLKMNHVEFNNDTGAAFNAPITEVLFLSLNIGRTSDELEKALNNWRSADASSEGETHPPTTWGATHEDPRKFIVLIGLSGKQIHGDFSARSRTISGGVMDELSILAYFEVLHLSLRGSVESE